MCFAPDVGHRSVLSLEFPYQLLFFLIWSEQFWLRWIGIESLSASFLERTARLKTKDLSITSSQTWFDSTIRWTNRIQE